MRIELRNDGWWDLAKNQFPDHYKAKQDLKRALEAIEEQPDKESLVRVLGQIEVSGLFEGKPYLFGRRIEIQTEGSPGFCYLGEIVR